MVNRPGFLPRRQPLRRCAQLLLLAAAGWACADAPADPELLPDVAGSWAYTERITHNDGTLTCDRIGTLTIEQQDDVLVGGLTAGLTCTGAAPASSAQSLPIAEGLVREEDVEFRIGQCRYTGRFEDSSPPSMGGSAYCVSDPASGADNVLGATGSWQASRLTDTTS